MKLGIAEDPLQRAATFRPHLETGYPAANEVSLSELQRENSRLHRLLGELLIKNQKLREALDRALAK